jgi:hypothetical protein
MLPDEVLLENGSTDITLSRVVDASLKPTQTIRRSADQLHALRIDQNTTGQGRVRFVATLLRDKAATETLPRLSSSMSLSSDRPLEGFSSADIADMELDLHLLVSAYIADLYAGEA